MLAVYIAEGRDEGVASRLLTRISIAD